MCCCESWWDAAAGLASARSGANFRLDLHLSTVVWLRWPSCEVYRLLVSIRAASKEQARDRSRRRVEDKRANPGLELGREAPARDLGFATCPLSLSTFSLLPGLVRGRRRRAAGKGATSPQKGRQKASLDTVGSGAMKIACPTHGFARPVMARQRSSPNQISGKLRNMRLPLQSWARGAQRTERVDLVTVDRKDSGVTFPCGEVGAVQSVAGSCSLARPSLSTKPEPRERGGRAGERRTVSW